MTMTKSLLMLSKQNKCHRYLNNYLFQMYPNSLHMKCLSTVLTSFQGTTYSKHIMISNQNYKRNCTCCHNTLQKMNIFHTLEAAALLCNTTFMFTCFNHRNYSIGIDFQLIKVVSVCSQLTAQHLSAIFLSDVPRLYLDAGPLTCEKAVMS